MKSKILVIFILLLGLSLTKVSYGEGNASVLQCLELCGFDTQPCLKNCTRDRNSCLGGGSNAQCINTYVQCKDQCNDLNTKCVKACASPD